MRGVPISWSPAELAFIESRRTLPRLELLAAFEEEFGRGLTLKNLKALCERRGWRTGRTGYRWTAGHAFGTAKPQGSERFEGGGYVKIKVGGCYVLKHRWRWEELHGPVPAGCLLKCLDGNRLNTDPANWVPVPRAMIGRLAGNFGRRVAYDDAPGELKPTIMAVARLEHVIGKATRTQQIND